MELELDLALLAVVHDALQQQVHDAIALAVEEHVPDGIEELHGALDLRARDGAPRDAGQLVLDLGEPPLDLADALVEFGVMYENSIALFSRWISATGARDRVGAPDRDRSGQLWLAGVGTTATQGAEQPEQAPPSRGCGRDCGVVKGIEPGALWRDRALLGRTRAEVELATPERERWLVQPESFYDARGHVYLELADGAPAELSGGWRCSGSLV
jgi:hypothetical protein